MMIRVFILLCGFGLLFSSQAMAEKAPLAIDLAEDRINIASGCTGSSWVGFGTKSSDGEVAVI